MVCSHSFLRELDELAQASWSRALIIAPFSGSDHSVTGWSHLHLISQQANKFLTKEKFLICAAKDNGVKVAYIDLGAVIHDLFHNEFIGPEFVDIVITLAKLKERSIVVVYRALSKSKSRSRT
jgi:hypothetical protein